MTKTAKKTYNNVSIDPDLFERIEPYVDAGGTNNRAFVQSCIEAICAMIEQPPGQRTVPELVIRISAVIENRKSPAALAEAQRREEMAKHGVKFPSGAEIATAKASVKSARKLAANLKRPKHGSVLQ